MSDYELRGRWIDHWEPEDERFWETTASAIARKNLFFSIFAEHFGFSDLGALDDRRDQPRQRRDRAVAVRAVLAHRGAEPDRRRRCGSPTRSRCRASAGGRGRRSAPALLLIPALLVAFLVPSGWLAEQAHDTQFWVLLACAATAGLGGGNFSSSMANISFFYPEGKKGLALGLNAAGGNLGVALTQLLVPLVDHRRRAGGGGEAAGARGAPRLRRAHLDAVHRRRRARRVALHGQPHAGEVRHALLRDGAARAARRG